MDDCGIYGVVLNEDSLSGVVDNGGEISGAVDIGGAVIGEVGFPKCICPPIYEGAYSVTPSAETQILNTADLTMSDNVVIDPIPSNYGLIQWNGAILTVS